MNTSVDLEWRLTGLYKEFLELNDLEGSADDILVLEKDKLDPMQRQFLVAFSQMWESINQ